VLTTHPYLVLRLKKELSYTSTPLWAFMACSRVNFIFTLPHSGTLHHTAHIYSSIITVARCIIQHTSTSALPPSLAHCTIQHTHTSILSLSGTLHHRAQRYLSITTLWYTASYSSHLHQNTVEPRCIVHVTFIFPHVLSALFGPGTSPI
jgi:hypothetical protein